MPSRILKLLNSRFWQLLHKTRFSPNGFYASRALHGRGFICIILWLFASASDQFPHHTTGWMKTLNHIIREGVGVSCNHCRDIITE